MADLKEGNRVELTVDQAIMFKDDTVKAGTCGTVGYVAPYDDCLWSVQFDDGRKVWCAAAELRKIET